MSVVLSDCLLLIKLTKLASRKYGLVHIAYYILKTRRIHEIWKKFLKLHYSDGIGVKVQWISLDTDSAKLLQVFVPWWNFWWNDQELRILITVLVIYFVFTNNKYWSTFTNHSWTHTGDMVKTNKLRWLRLA